MQGNQRNRGISENFFGDFRILEFLRWENMSKSLSQALAFRLFLLKSPVPNILERAVFCATPLVLSLFFPPFTLQNGNCNMTSEIQTRANNPPNPSSFKVKMCQEGRFESNPDGDVPWKANRALHFQQRAGTGSVYNDVLTSVCEYHLHSTKVHRPNKGNSQ